MNVHPLYHSVNGSSKGLPKVLDVPGNVTFALPGLQDSDEVRVTFRHEFIHTDRNKQIETIARASLLAFGLLLGVFITCLVRFHS